MQAARGRGARRTAGRARRSADDQEGDESTAQNGTSLVGQVVEGVKNLVMGESATTGAEGEKSTAGRGGKAKRGRGAARAPRVKKERGEPSKTVRISSICFFPSCFQLSFDDIFDSTHADLTVIALYSSSSSAIFLSATAKKKSDHSLAATV